MEEDLIFAENNNRCEVKNCSPAALAFFGDAVYEILVREYVLCGGDVKASRLSENSRAFVTACAQSKAVDIISPMLDSEEMAFYKLGRNANGVKAPKSATSADYRRATGLEVLFAALWLSGKQQRARELFDIIARHTSQG